MSQEKGNSWKIKGSTTDLSFDEQSIEIQWNSMFSFHFSRFQAIISIKALYYTSTCISYCVIILNLQVLQSLAQFVSYVPSFRCFMFKISVQFYFIFGLKLFSPVAFGGALLYKINIAGQKKIHKNHTQMCFTFVNDIRRHIFIKLMKFLCIINNNGIFFHH